MTTTISRATVATATATFRPALWRPALVSGVAAAAATTALAAALRAAGVPLAVDGAPIPLVGFATLTLIGVALGFLLALGLRRFARTPRHTFVMTTTALTAASLIPDLLGTATLDTRLSLMALHLVAAAIVIPALASRLSDQHR